MDRRTTNRPVSTAPKIGLIVSTALASLALAGCASSAPPAQVSFNKAQTALEDGKVDRAITYAESAVLAEPRNASYRAILGAAYLEAGRFNSAATSFGDALDLGDTDPRTVLSYALAQTAIGNNAAAVDMLNQHANYIPQADLGLALALAGEAERGVYVLVNAVRNGDAGPKARQNLAYTYALAGNWRAARVMAAEDVPADQLDERLSQWAASSRPEDYQVRVAGLLDVAPAYDSGQPRHLALSNFPSQQQMVAEAEAQTPVEAPVAIAVAEEPKAANPEVTTPEVVSVAVASPEPVAPVAPVAQPSPAPVAETAPVAPAAPRFVSNAVVQDISAPAAAERAERASRPVSRPSSQRRMAIASGAAATHMVQLGSFDSRAVAESKWNEFQSRFPELAGRNSVITEAVVDGRTFFRLAADGFGQNSARGMCDAVKSAGRDCFTYAAATPPAGVVDRSVRVASRGR